MTDPYTDGATELADAPQTPAAHTSIVLLKVDARARINLADLVTSGVEFFTGATDPTTGVITLTPVKVATTSIKRTTGDEQ